VIGGGATGLGVARGAIVLNHCRVVGLAEDGRGTATARVHGVELEDRETGQRVTTRARCVVNATGVWVDAGRRRCSRFRAVNANSCPA
jgi:glycerol-3-phosphate dehydrogenase